MHEEVLAEDQVKLLPLLKSFSSDFTLIGGTAVALQLGHRKSIDFDLATLKALNSQNVLSLVRNQHKIDSILVDNAVELTVVIQGVKFTFLHYPFKFESPIELLDMVKSPDLVTLAALKAYALGRRAKWKDYVDLYFIFKTHQVNEIAKRAENIYGTEFNEKLFREQLSYFEDIDYTEVVNFIPGQEVTEEKIKEALIEISLLK